MLKLAKILILVLACAFVAKGQTGSYPPDAGGSSICTITNSPTLGYVVTATSGGNCSWQTVGGASVSASTVANAVYVSDTGTANTVVGTTVTSFPASYSKGYGIWFIANATNTGATTINISSVGVVNLTKNGATALAAGNKVSGTAYLAVYDGTEFELIGYTLVSGDIPNNAANTTGNAATATACGTVANGNLVQAGASNACTDSNIAGNTVVQLTTTQTITNKTVDGVTPTTMGFVDPTSSIQTQLNAKQASLTTGSQDSVFNGTLGLTSLPTCVASGGVYRYSTSTHLFTCYTLASADIPNNAANTSGTAAGLTTYPTLCSGGQFSQGLSSGSNNCANTPAGFSNPMTAADQFIGSGSSSSGTAAAEALVNCTANGGVYQYSTTTHLFSCHTLVSADIPNNAANTTGNATTATNLASYPTLCTGGQFSQGLSSGSNNCGTPSGSSGSVFTGSTATNPSFSATPTFSLADVSVKSPVRVEPGALTANVTSVTFTNLTAGAKFSIAWTQDVTGGRTVSYGASASNTCTVDPTASATTTQDFEVGANGTTVNGTGCTSTVSDTSGPEIAKPGTPASGTGVCWWDSTNHIYSCMNNGSSTVGNVVIPSTLASHNFATSISAAGVIGSAQPAFTDISGSATNSQLPGTGSTTVDGQTCTLGSTCTTTFAAQSDAIASAHVMGTTSGKAPVAATAADMSAINYVAGGGSANAQTATYAPAIAALVNGLSVCWLPTAANTTSTPTFAPNGLATKTIVKVGGAALAANDLTTTAIACAIYDGTNWELQNPQTTSGSPVTSVSGDGALITNSASTGGVTLTLGTAGAHKVWMNNTGSTATPGYQTIGTGDLPGSGATTVDGQTCTLGSTCTTTFAAQSDAIASANILGTTSGKAPVAASAVNLAAINWAVGTGTGNAQTATYSPIPTLVPGLTLCWLPTAPNTGAATFSPNSITAHSLVRVGGTALLANDLVSTANACAVYNSTSTNWELQNAQTVSSDATTVNGATIPASAAPVCSNSSSQIINCTITGTGSTVVVSASPALTGTPTAPTQTSGDTSTDIATDAFVSTAVTNAIAAVNPAVAVEAATAAVLPNTPTYANGVGGIGATLTSATNTALIIDGYTVLLNDRVLVQNQASSFQNGVYTQTTLGTGSVAWVLTRATDFDQPSDMNNTGIIPVINGTANADTTWLLTSSVTTVGTSAVTFTQFTVNPTTVVTAASNYTNGDLVQAAGANKTTSDSGIATTNVVTAVSNYTNGDLVQAAGANKTTSDSGIAVANVVTAASAASAANQVCVASGASKTCSYIDFPERYMIPAANCNNATGGAGWSVPAAETIICPVGTNNLGGEIVITDTSSTFAQFQLSIPVDWNSAVDPYILVGFESVTDTTSGHTVIPQIRISCPTAVNGTVTNDHAFAVAHSLTTVTFGGSAVAHGFYTTSVQMNSTDMTGCIAGGPMTVQIGRATDTATGNIGFAYADVTFPRRLVLQAN